MEPWEKKIRSTCLWMLVLAMLIRLAGSTGNAASNNAEAAAFLIYLSTGRVGHPGAISTEPVTIRDTSPETVPRPSFSDAGETEPPSSPARPFSSEAAEGLRIRYGTQARPDIPFLLTAPCDLDFSGDSPRILILHTHATESYTPTEGWTYTPSGSYRTLDESRNMIAVGDRIAEALNEAGITTLHARDFNDYPSYNSSYSRALEVIHTYLETYPTIQMVIDVHRDAMETEDGQQLGTEAAIRGNPSAQLLLVMGSNEGGLYHPDWQGNLSWALKLMAQGEEDFPGLFRPLSLRPERYNEHATPGSILLEVGSAGDTLPEALTAADAFAEVLIRTIQRLGLDQMPE